MLASTDVILWRQRVLPLLDLFLPSFIVRYRMFSLVICSRWSSSSLHASCSPLSHCWDFSSLFIWPLVVFSLVPLLSLWSFQLLLFPHLWWSSFDFFEIHQRSLFGHTWSSYGRPLLCNSLLRVDLDPLDRVIQPASFTTAGAIWPHPHLRVSQMRCHPEERRTSYSRYSFEWIGVKECIYIRWEVFHSFSIEHNKRCEHTTKIEWDISIKGWLNSTTYTRTDKKWVNDNVSHWRRPVTQWKQTQKGRGGGWGTVESSA